MIERKMAEMIRMLIGKKEKRIIGQRERMEMMMENRGARRHATLILTIGFTN